MPLFWTRSTQLTATVRASQRNGIKGDVNVAKVITKDIHHGSETVGYPSIWNKVKNDFSSIRLFW